MLGMFDLSEGLDLRFKCNKHLNIYSMLATMRDQVLGTQIKNDMVVPSRNSLPNQGDEQYKMVKVDRNLYRVLLWGREQVLRFSAND